MTDDKGEGDWPYRVVRDGSDFVLDGPKADTFFGKSKVEELNIAYAKGKKAERKITARLIMYARHRDSCGDMDAQNHDEFPSCNCGLDELKDAIRGGQDGK